MTVISDDEPIPVLYAIRHCEYGRYPNDTNVLELTDQTIETMKEAYRQIRIAEIYATRVDWMMRRGYFARETQRGFGSL